MIAIFFLISATNLAVGFAVAVMLNHAPPWHRIRRRKKAAKKSKKTGNSDDADSAGVGTGAAAPGIELPAAWRETLGEDAAGATSFVEASMQVIGLEVGRYRQRLLEIDARLRVLGDNGPADKLEAIMTELAEANRDWQAKQADAAGHLTDRQGDLGSLEDTGRGLEKVLLEQAAQIETTSNNLAGCDVAADPAAASKRLMREICRLVDLTHALRDRLSESLLSVVVAENKLAKFDSRFQTDALTGMPNRFGFEVLLHDWWRQDAARQRLTSCVLINVDRLGKLNERFGAQQVDDILGGMARWLSEHLRKERGFDRLARLDGESLILLMGDTGPRNATSAAERIRQTLEVTSFELEGETLELTASFAVVEIEKKDNSARLLKRLRQTMEHAKHEGRNRTSLDEGRGPQAVEPPQFQVKASVVRL